MQVRLQDYVCTTLLLHLPSTRHVTVSCLKCQTMQTITLSCVKLKNTAPLADIWASPVLLEASKRVEFKLLSPGPPTPECFGCYDRDADVTWECLGSDPFINRTLVASCTSLAVVCKWGQREFSVHSKSDSALSSSTINPHSIHVSMTKCFHKCFVCLCKILICYHIFLKLSLVRQLHRRMFVNLSR